MIIETFGLPGSGKSTFIKKVTASINSAQYQAVNVSYWCQFFPIKAFRKVMGIVLLQFQPASGIVQRLKKKHTKELGKYSYISPIDMYLQGLVFLKWIYKKLKSSSAVFLFDEGVYQCLIAMAADFDLSKDEIEQLLQLFEPDCLPNISIMYELSVSECVLSIKTRDRHVCDIDELPREKLLDFLGCYEGYFSWFSGIIPNMITLHRKDSFSQKASLLLKLIDEV